MTKPLHIGIYGDYGFTPRPDEGIGVFLFNLIDGLLEVEPGTRITLWVHPGEEHRMQHLLDRHQGHVRVYPPADNPLLGHCLDGINDLRRWLGVILLGRTSDRLQRWLITRWKNEGASRASSSTRAIKLMGLAVACCLLAPLVWLSAMVYHLLVNGLLKALTFPAELLLRWRRPDAPLYPPACDVWLVPHGRTAAELNAPEVLILWDVVHHHVSGVFGEDVQELTDRYFFQRARKAALICCASRAVLEQDLRRLFPWAEDRFRVVPLAAPRDLQSPLALRRRGIGGSLDVRRRFGLKRPYLFYPAAIRAHKNHTTLLRALAWLRQQGLELELVCTGKGEQSTAVQTVLAETALSDYVRFLGLVDRSAISDLFRQAAVAVVPTLHEGYGLPALEALACGCPLACADIPSLRELLAGHDEAIAFFDPRDHEAVGAAVLRILERPEHYRAAQREVFAELARRDWGTVASEFFELFREALEQGEPRDAQLDRPTEVLAHA